MNTFKGILRGLTPRIRWLPLAAGSLVLLLGLGESKAQPPRGIETGAAQGTVERMTTAPRGEIDGAVLDNGTWLHWPPHMQDRFAKVVREGDRVRATGRTETGPAGDTHFEVEAVTNVRTNVAIENPDYAFGPPPPPPAFRGRGRRGPPPPPVGSDRRFARAERGETTTVQGNVKRLTTAPRGEIDGALLDDGTWLHWPPHMQDRFTNIVKEGERVRASGQTETGPAGDTHFEIQHVTNLRSNSTADNPDFGYGPPLAPSQVAPDRPADREQRLRELEDQVKQLQREIKRLQSEK